MKYAWIEDSVIRDIAHGNPTDCYTPEVAASYSTEVPDDAESGDGWVNGTLIKPEVVVPPPPEPEVPVPSKVSPVEFKLLFTPQERVAIKAVQATDPMVADFYEIVEDPRLTHVDLGLASVQQALTYLMKLGLLAPDRLEKILMGTLQ